MKIVIVGAGRAGLEVAMHLTRIGHAVTIIDSDEAVTRRASEQYGLVALSGDATVAAVLEEADIAQSDVVVAMLRRDADNLAVALLARAAGVERVMVRMRDNAYRPVYAAAGIDRVLSETDLITGSVATAIEHEAIRHAMLLGNGSAIAFELTVPAGSAAAGKTVMELAALPGLSVLLRVRRALPGRRQRRGAARLGGGPGRHHRAAGVADRRRGDGRQSVDRSGGAELAGANPGTPVSNYAAKEALMRPIALALLLLVVPAVAHAHHSGSEYDRTTVEIEGTLVELVWQNPHVHFGVRTVDAKGKTVTWDIEANSLSILRRTDANPDNLKLGDRIKVAGAPSRQTPNKMWASNILPANGREVVLGPGTPPRWGTTAAGAPSPPGSTAAPTPTRPPASSASGAPGSASAAACGGGVITR